MTKPLRDGWIKWTGVGEPPTGLVDIRLRRGMEFARQQSWAFNWNHELEDARNEIVAYRRLTEETQPSSPPQNAGDRLVKIEVGDSSHTRTAQQWIDLARADLRSNAAPAMDKVSEVFARATSPELYAAPQSDAAPQAEPNPITGQGGPAKPAAAAPDKMAALVDRFLKWKLPTSVCSDSCVSYLDCPFERTGANLLLADEARQMLEYVLAEETKS